MTSSTDEVGSVTFWLSQLRLGHGHARRNFWERYYERLVRHAQKRMSRSPKRVEDEEDVVQSAFATFYANMAHGRFPQVQDRHDLWRLLIIITARKATDRVRREKALKRGGSPPGALRIFDVGSGKHRRRRAKSGIRTASGRNGRRLLDSLPSPSLRALAISKLEGYTNDRVPSVRLVRSHGRTPIESDPPLWQAHEG